MTPETWQRLFGYRHAFDDPVTLWGTVAIVAVAGLAGLAIQALWRMKRMRRETYEDAFVRWRSWLAVSAFILVPILLGAAWTMAAVAALSLACGYEYARVTGLWRERALCAVVVAGILLVTFAAADHYDRLFFAAAPLTVSLLAVITIPIDQPRGYIQRVALASFGFLLFGFSLGYLSNLANHVNYRPILMLIILGVELNDIFAYCVGRTLGGPKLLPTTSPGKTVAGSLGACVLTTVLVAGLAHVVFLGTAVDRLSLLVTLGVMIGGLGQLGDLVLSSLKRDLGIKDIGSLIPGHGGLLDRFDSLILVPPAVFHFLSYHLGPLAADQPSRIFTEWLP
jgi:phosphatidate cytidylyltransferase